MILKVEPPVPLKTNIIWKYMKLEILWGILYLLEVRMSPGTVGVFLQWKHFCCFESIAFEIIALGSLRASSSVAFPHRKPVDRVVERNLTPARKLDNPIMYLE